MLFPRSANVSAIANEQRLSIAVVTGSTSRLAGGLFSSVRSSAQALSAMGHDLSVLTLEDRYTEDDLDAWKPLVPVVAARFGPSFLGFGPAISEALFNGKFDLVHQHGLWLTQSAQVASWRHRTGRPVMISPRGMLDSWALQNSKWKKLISALFYERGNLKGATCIHALNTAEAGSIRAFGIDRPIATIPNGTALPSRSIVRRRPDWLPKDGRQSLLFVGRIHPKKGLEVLVDAWARLKDSSPDTFRSWRLIIAGWDDGGHLADIRSRISQACFSADDVLLPGAIYGSEKDATFEYADAFVLPSYSEGMPMAVLEAWSWGLPVFMTKACNLPEGFIEGAAFEIIADAAALASKLATFLAADQVDCRRAAGTAGRLLVEKRFTWDSVASQHDAVYRWMIDGGPVPNCVQMA